MSFLVWLLLGVVIGYLGSLIMRSDADRGAILSTVAGILGALLAGRLLAPFVGGARARASSASAPCWSPFLGAVVLVGVVNVLRRGRDPRSAGRGPPAGLDAARTHRLLMGSPGLLKTSHTLL